MQRSGIPAINARGTRLNKLDNSLASNQMATYAQHRVISITKLKNECHSVIRQIETTSQLVAITRRGKVVARIAPSTIAIKTHALKPWEQLRKLGGHLIAPPGQSMVG